MSWKIFQFSESFGFLIENKQGNHVIYCSNFTSESKGNAIRNCIGVCSAEVSTYNLYNPPPTIIVRATRAAKAKPVNIIYHEN